jgi:hypothetical protein
MQERLADAINAQTAADAEIKVCGSRSRFAPCGLAEEVSRPAPAAAAAEAVP